jgi:hypothetical protein
MPLLDKFAEPNRPFRPSTVQEFLALQIARQLSDLQNFKWYIHSLAGMARSDVLLALEKAFRAESTPENRALRFRKELTNLSANYQSHAQH